MSVFLSSFLANSFIAFVLIAFTLLLKNFKSKIIKHIKGLTAFTVGILFSLIFLHFIPEISEKLEAPTIGLSLLLGLLCFYSLELILHWHHCSDLENSHCDHSHARQHDEHKNLMFFGTLLHNIFHGFIIFSSFTISTATGISLTIGILFHALPQNIANFIMNHENMKSIYLAAIGGIIGTLICYPFESGIEKFQYLILGFTTGGLLYLSLSDILPSVNGNASSREKFTYLFLVLFGILLMWAMSFI